jgi:hypothetical protein
VLSRFRHFHDLFGMSGTREVEAFKIELTNGHDRRRRFLLAVLRLGPDGTVSYYLQRQQLLQASDLIWLTGLCPGSRDYDPSINAPALCTLIRSIVDLYDPSQFDAVYEAAERWPLLWETFRFTFEGIPLESHDAQQLRRHFKAASERQKQSRPPIAPEPAIKIAEELDKFDNGDTDAWWRLNLYLTLTPASTYFGSDLAYSIAKTPGWLNAGESTRRRILNAAVQYLGRAENSAEKWIAKSPQPLVRSDISAFRALLLLKSYDQSIYEKLPSDVWKKWAGVVVAIPRPSEDKDPLENQVVIDALSAAPMGFVRVVREIIQVERKRSNDPSANSAPAPGGSFWIIRQLDGCWGNQALKEGLFAELERDDNSKDQFACLLDVLLAADFTPAKDLAIEYIRREPGEPRAIVSAVSLSVHKPGEAWSDIWKLVTENKALAETFFLEVGQRHRFREFLFEGLSEQELAALYVSLENTFPRQEGRISSRGPHWVGPHETVNHMRDSILPQIVARGTEGSVSAIQWVVRQLPKLQWLSYHLLEAQRVMRIKTWLPLSPKELFSLLASPDRTLVRSIHDLVDLLVAALRKYELELHGEQNPIRALWDRQGSGKSFRPVEEDAFSDSVRLFLKRELIDAGVVVNREVEIARVPGAPIGTRTDIRVDAIRRRSDGSYDSIASVIESKGCWNKALYTDLKDQLFGDYMVRLGLPVGIYLVAWFDKRKWDPGDRRRGRAPDLTPKQAQERLEAEAALIPTSYSVRPIVIDCHAP